MMAAEPVAVVDRVSFGERRFASANNSNPYRDRSRRHREIVFATEDPLALWPRENADPHGSA